MKTIGKTLIGVGIGVALTALGAVATAYSGLYDVAADAPHTRPVAMLLEIARERSVAARAKTLQVPAGLDDPARIRQGAGNYDAMCAGCHLSPGSGESELSRGLYPSPPDLTRGGADAAEAFWTIKHGIKASGMPAWGRSMDDAYIWNMAAFLQELPKLDRDAYAALVAGSGGHSHGGGETGGGHAHDGPSGEEAHPHAPPEASHGEDAGDGQAAAPAREHVHADGARHVHEATPSPEQAPPRPQQHNDDDHPHPH